MTLTKVFLTVVLDKAESLSIIPRVHGDGFIQLDLPFLKKRLHGWGHPDILSRKESLRIHDHRFWLRSKVLVGHIRNDLYYLEQADTGEVVVYTIQRNNPSVSKQGPPYEYPVIRDSRRYNLKLFRSENVRAGQSYEHPAGILHHTKVLKPSISLVEKLFTDDSYAPRVIIREGDQVDNSFSRYSLPKDHIYRILRELIEG